MQRSHGNPELRRNGDLWLSSLSGPDSEIALRDCGRGAAASSS